MLWLYYMPGGYLFIKSEPLPSDIAWDTALGNITEGQKYTHHFFDTLHNMIPK
jgi:hypothetical protein